MAFFVGESVRSDAPGSGGTPLHRLKEIMDTSTEAPITALNIDSGAAAFADLLEPPKQEEEANVDTEIDPPKEESEVEAPAEDDSDITIEVDGKSVKLSKEELAEAYKNGLRQSDYTKKTMEVAETRKVAEAEIVKARQEREAYGQNLNKMAAQLEGALQEQQKIDWQQLLDADPVEYLKQQHLFQQRQAAYQQTQQAQQQLAMQHQAEQANARQLTLSQQQEELLAKLPDWKDPAKAKAEKAAIGDYLKSIGFDNEAVSNISDHRAVILARKAMLYDQMLTKANAATKRVQAAPQRVVKPGVGDSPRTDGRSAAMQRLGKSGRVEDAAAVFASFL